MIAPQTILVCKQIYARVLKTTNIWLVQNFLCKIFGEIGLNFKNIGMNTMPTNRIRAKINDKTTFNNKDQIYIKISDLLNIQSIEILMKYKRSN